MPAFPWTEATRIIPPYGPDSNLLDEDVKAEVYSSSPNSLTKGSVRSQILELLSYINTSG